MAKIKIECSYCLLGIGYTSIIASHFLKQKGIESLVLGIATDRALFDIQLSSDLISPLPIFPVYDSFLYQTLKLNEGFPQTIVEVSHTELNNCEVSKFTFKPNSLAEFILRDSSELSAFSLSMKQWGPAMLDNPYSEVKNKIIRHYLSGNNNSRVGYFNGMTLYYHFMNQSNPNILNFKLIEKIDYANKIIYTDSFEIYFRELISTIPVQHLFAYCKIPLTMPLLFEGSYFFYFSHASDFKANKIVYDYDLSSDILRVFSAKDNIIVTQLPGYKKGKVKIVDVARRLRELIPTLKELKFEKELHLTMSYPIESITNSQTLESIHLLKDNSILTFGRFGNWEYSDLHELNWKAFYDTL